MPSTFFADTNALQLVIPIVVGTAITGFISLLPELVRQKFGAVSSRVRCCPSQRPFRGLRVAFCALMTVLAYAGLKPRSRNRRRLDRACDLGYFHHLYGNPIIPVRASLFIWPRDLRSGRRALARGRRAVDPDIFARSARRADAANL